MCGWSRKEAIIFLPHPAEERGAPAHHPTFLPILLPCIPVPGRWGCRPLHRHLSPRRDMNVLLVGEPSTGKSHPPRHPPVAVC